MLLHFLLITIKFDQGITKVIIVGCSISPLYTWISAAKFMTTHILKDTIQPDKWTKTYKQINVKHSAASTFPIACYILWNKESMQAYSTWHILRIPPRTLFPLYKHIQFVITSWKCSGASWGTVAAVIGDILAFCGERTNPLYHTCEYTVKYRLQSMAHQQPMSKHTYTITAVN